MGLGDFWLQFNNGKKEQLKDAKHGVRKEQLDSKFQNLFDAFDVNKDGTLENNELETIENWTKKLSKGDNVLNANENMQAKSVFSEQINIQDADFQGFVQSLSKASEDIVAVTEKPMPDGGKEIKTEYKDGSVETISYYPDGSYKFKKFDHEYTQNTVSYTIGGDQSNQYTESQIDGIIRKDYQKALSDYNKQKAEYDKNALTNRELGIMPPLAPLKYKDYKSLYIQQNNICQNTSNNRYEIHNLELSDRAKFDVEVRKFLIEHYVETHQGAKDALDTMGILDDIGAAINTGAGELWNSIVNVYNKWFGDGTQEDYQNFYELVNKFNPHYDKSLMAKGDLEFMTNHPDAFFGSFETDIVKNTGHKFELEKTLQFQHLTEQYQTATIYKQRIDLLKKALSEIDMYWSEQNALVYAPAQNEGLNPASHIVSANNYLLAFFGNDQEAADMVLNGTIGNPDATKTKIKELLQDAQGALDDALLKRTTTLESDGTGSMMMNIATQGMEQYSYDELQAKYQSEYKEMYGVDFVPDELTEKVMGAKATGGMVKIAAITIISIIITRSPIMAEISGAAGGAAIEGASANLIRTLVTKYGQTAVQQGIKFAMTTGTLATDIGLTLLNQVTSERGYNGAELWESAKGSAKYIYFGAYIGSPVAQAVSQRISQIGVAGKLMSGGMKSTKGAIQTTTISGDKLLANISGEAEGILAKGKAFLKALPAKTGGFAADVGMFTGLEIVTEGVDPLTAGAEQGEMLGKLKIMNHFLEYMLGAKTHTAVNRARWDVAVERAGVKNWNIKEIKAPSTDGKGVKTTYYVDIDGIPIGKFENADMLTTAMMERVASVYSTIPANENKASEDVTTDETPLTRDDVAGNIKTAAGEVIDSETTSNDLMDLSLRNPAQLAEARVREEWQQHDLKTKAPETDEPAIIFKDGKFVVNEDLAARQLSKPLPSVSDEVTSLIFSGKLGQELTRRYEAASDLFNNALQKHKSKIQQFAIEHKDNPQMFAQEVANILSEEFGMKGLEPSVKFVDGSKISGAANFDWSESQIEISDKITDFNQIAELVSHEFNHLLQFADIVAQYGKEGITDLLNQNKSFIAASKDLSPEQKAQLVDLYVETEYNQKLIEHVKDKRAEEGSLNDYLRRIYKEELTNPVTSNEPGYTEQVTENEAFFIGNKNGRALGITGKLTEEQFEKLKQENPDIHEGSDGTIFKLNEDGTITKLGIKFPSGETVSEDMGIVRNIIAELRARQDDLFNDIKKGNIVPKEDKIKQLEVLIDKIKQTKNVVKEDDARRTLDDALELAEDMKLNSEQIIRANSTLRDFGVVIDFKEVDETTAREIMRAKFPQEIIEERKAYYSSRYNDAESQLESSIKNNIDEAIKACTVNGKISLELIDKYIEIFSKNLTYDFKVKEYISRFKFQFGIDKNAMEFFDEQTRGAEDYNEAYEKTSKIISTCQNKQGLFDKEYYEKLINFCNGEEADFYANGFISFCKIDGELNESLYEKGMALKRLGFTNSQVVKLMEECAKKPNERYGSDSKFFKQELYDRIEEMVNQNIDKEQICDFLSHCISETRVFDETAYNMLLEFRKHVDDENTTWAAHQLGKCENIEEACRYVDDLRNKYNVSSKQVTNLYRIICDEIKTSDGKEVYRHNPQKYEKAVELLSKYNVEEWAATKIIDDCTVDGKFDIKLYNKFIELKEYGLSELLKMADIFEKDGDRGLEELLHRAIHEEVDSDGNKTSKHNVDYEILDKLKVWTDIYRENFKKLNLDERETERYWLTFKNNVECIMDCINSSHSNGAEFVEKFFNLGINNVDKILKSAYVRDENGKINYLKFDKNILNSYLKLAQTHEMSEETLLKATKLSDSDRYYGIDQPTEYVVSNIAAIDRLLKAGWDKSLSGMDDLFSYQKFSDHMDMRIIDQDKVKICEYALKNGIPSKNIFDIIQYCDNNTEHSQNGWHYNRRLFNPADLDRVKFKDLVEIMKHYDKNTSASQSDYNKCVERLSKLLEYKKEILECIQSGKQLDRLAGYLNYMLLHRGDESVKLTKEKMPEIFEAIKNNPAEVLDEINERICQDLFYFDHLEELSHGKILEDCGYYNRRHTTNEEMHSHLQEITNILKALDSDGVKPENLLKYAKCLFRTVNNNYTIGKQKNICPEVLSKMKELIKSGELDELFTEEFHLELADGSVIAYNCAMDLTSFSFFSYDNPKFVGVLDALVKAKKDGLFDNKIMQKLVLEHLDNNHCEDGFISNYQDIIDFYKENKDFILSFDLEKDADAYKNLKAIFDYRTKVQFENDENGNKITPISIQEDVQTLNKIVKYMKLLENKSVFTNIMQYVDLKDVVNFLDKVDMNKYSSEVNELMNDLVSQSSINYYNKIFDSSLTEREINFILDIQQLYNKTINEHNAEVDATGNGTKWGYERNGKYTTLLNNDFFEIFTNGYVSDEAMNKLRFYIESNLSIPENKGSIGNISELRAIINVYKNRPDKIDETEHYMFNESNYDRRRHYIAKLQSISTDKVIADLEWTLLDDAISYKNTSEESHILQDIFRKNDSQEIAQAKLNVWNAIKPTDKNASAETLNAVLSTICSIAPYKQDVIIDAHKAGYSSNDLKLLSNYIRETTAEKIHDLIKQNYPLEFVIKVAANSRTNVHVEYGTRMLQEGRYEDGEIGDLIAPISDETVEIAELIYFNKEEVFPSDIAKNIVNSARSKNQKLICDKLVKDKSFPRDRINDVIQSVYSDESYQLADRLFSDEHKEFSIDQKLEILKCTKYNNIQDLDTYIRDIYYGVERSCPIRTACAYSQYGSMLKSMEIRENIMKHSKILKQHGIESDEKAIDKMLTTQESTANGNYDGGIKAYGLDGVNELLKITDMATIENATQLKFTGFKNFLLYGSLLSRLSPENHAKLKEVLAKFPYPEQKVQKIQIVTSLIGNISDADLTTLINEIESPSLTAEQKSAVERIFSPENKKPYSEKIEDFIKEFNVPATKVDNIRSWLISAKLDTKFIVPKPIEEQIKDIDRRILNNERLINSGKIPEEGIGKMRASIDAAKAQREDMIANPDKYTKIQINDKQMPIIESKIRDNINYPNQTKAFIEDTCKLLYAKMGIQKPSQDLLDAINYDFKYFARIFAGLDNPGWHSDEGFTFRTEFTKLINLLMANPGKNLTEARMTIPENQKTKEMFIENGLDFEFWNKFDDNFKHKFSTLIKRDQAVAEVLNNLKNELETDLFKTFDEKEREQLLNKIKVAVDSISKTDDPVENNLLEANTILNVIENELKENEYWKQNAGMFSDHIKDHHKKVHDAKDIKDREVTLYVRLSDSDDIGRNIFFGDHVGCCTSSGGGNGFAAPQHLQNAFVRGYELVDENGISYGNSMCFFAKIDGKLTFVIDSFEANGQLAASEEVPEALIKFAHMVCAREGRPDAQVMFGPNYNHIAKSRFKETSGHSIEMVGAAPCDTYIDSMGGFGDINEPYETSMNEIIE